VQGGKRINKFLLLLQKGTILWQIIWSALSYSPLENANHMPRGKGIKMRKAVISLSLFILSGIIIWSCGGGGNGRAPQQHQDAIKTAVKVAPKDTLTPPEEGGYGFEKIAAELGYETYGGIPEGSPEAVKGGRLVLRFQEFPASLRPIGKDSNYDILSMITGLVYEPLLGYEYRTGKYTRALATHWWISKDLRTFRYRINPDARWSDGEPVTAEDVVESWRLRTDEGILDPYANMLYGKFERPKILGKYIVEVHTKELNWRLFLYFSGMQILPAHKIKDLTGSMYLEKYQFGMLPGTGPYILDRARMRKGKSLALVRRLDWWAKDLPENVGLYNFDVIKFLIVQDDRLTFEKFKKGELDINFISRAQWWVQELDTSKQEFDALYRGLIQKRKIFNYHWKGISGIAFNQRRAPFNDLRVRKALAELWNREQLIDKLFFNEYIPLKSYFPGGVYENPNNPQIHYDPEDAVRLLAEAGWKERNSEGWLVKDGKIFEMTMGISQSIERIFTPYQEDLRKVGIKLNLKYVTPQTMFKNVMNERNFDIHYQAWTGLMIPNPESMWLSSLADKPGTTNITGFKNERVDEICKAYNTMLDPQERVQAIREIDSILAANMPYALGWGAPYTVRMVFWRKFGYPKSYVGYSGDWKAIPVLWWLDPKKNAELEKAKRDRSIRFPKGPIDIYYDKLKL